LPTSPSLHDTLPIFPQIPIDDVARKDLIRLENEAVDYLPSLSSGDKRVKLNKTSYKDFLLQSAKVHPDVVKVLFNLTRLSPEDRSEEHTSELQSRGH